MYDSGSGDYLGRACEVGGRGASDSFFAKQVVNATVLTVYSRQDLEAKTHLALLTLCREKGVVGKPGNWEPWELRLGVKERVIQRILRKQAQLAGQQH